MIFADKNNQARKPVKPPETGSVHPFLEIGGERPEQLLQRAIARFGKEIALASSFSMEDNVLLDMLLKIDKQARVLALDTGRLDEETYECAEKIRRKYGCRIEWFFPDKLAIEELVREKGLYSFRENIENRKQCCFIRKVEPLKRALTGLRAWATGQRREQSVTRLALDVVEIDEAHGGLIKLNPLADWSIEQVKDYVSTHNIPYNRLYDYGYSSIGCAPCTRALQPGEHERAGRWWWESETHKECGIHLLQAKPQALSSEE